MENMKNLGTLELHDYTIDPLKANESWVSKGESSFETGRVVGLVYSDKSGTIYIEQSGDGLSWDVIETISITGGSGKGFTIEKVAHHVRVRYVNGAADQAVFRLYVYKRVRVI